MHVRRRVPPCQRPCPHADDAGTAGDSVAVAGFSKPKTSSTRSQAVGSKVTKVADDSWVEPSMETLSIVQGILNGKRWVGQTTIAFPRGYTTPIANVVNTQVQEKLTEKGCE